MKASTWRASANNTVCKRSGNTVRLTIVETRDSERADEYGFLVA
jgi:hypothetical protein